MSPCTELEPHLGNPFSPLFLFCCGFRFLGRWLIELELQRCSWLELAAEHEFRECPLLCLNYGDCAFDDVDAMAGVILERGHFVWPDGLTLINSGSGASSHSTDM